MPAVTALPDSASREQSNPAIQNHARLRVVLPLCVIVALAIMCIVIAALTSAQRANDVAIEHDKELFLNSLVNRADWSLRKLKTVMGSGEIEREAAPVDLDLVLQRVGLGLKTLIDPDYVLVADASDQL